MLLAAVRVMDCTSAHDITGLEGPGVGNQPGTVCEARAYCVSLFLRDLPAGPSLRKRSVQLPQDVPNTLLGCAKLER